MRNGPSAVAGVLNLQRLAGNRAVTRALQRRQGSAEFYAASLANEDASDRNSFTAAAVGGKQATRPGHRVRSAMAKATRAELDASQHPTMAQLGVPPSQVKARALAAYVANSAYRAHGFNPLPGATRDASAMEAVMKRNRYTTKFWGQDFTGLQLLHSYRVAVESAAEGDALFLYYAGHGLATGPIGVDVATNTKAAVARATLPYPDLIATVEAGVAHGVHVTLVVDACRSGALTDLVRLKEERRLGASTDKRIQAVLSQIAHLRSLLALVDPAGGGGGAGGRGVVLDDADAAPAAPPVQTLWKEKVRPALLEVEPCVTTPANPLHLPTAVSDANDVIQAVQNVITRLLDLAHRLEQPPPAPKLPG